MHTTGAAAQQKQPINTTIGINKLGTLLSSQTTDTPGTTQTNIQDRSGATFQTYPTPPGFANPRFRDTKPERISPTQHRYAQKRTIFQAVQRRGVGRYLSASAAATQKTIPATTPNRKSSFPAKESPEFRGRK